MIATKEKDREGMRAAGKVVKAALDAAREFI